MKKQILVIHHDFPTNNDNSYNGVANGRSFYE